MQLSRRKLVAGVAASAVPFRPASGNTSRNLYLSGCRLADGNMAAALFDEAGEMLLLEPLDARAHGGAVSPDRQSAVLFARRPGRFAVVIDVDRAERVAAFAPPAGRRFQGHGAFSADGTILYCAENDFDAERGVVGLYDATNGFARLGEFATYGVGPHELCLLSDGETLAVANGGIATHPDFPRMKLNLASMAPSLVLLRASDGELIEKATLPTALHQVSIRHIAEGRRGEIWFGAQYEGPVGDAVPLVGTLSEAAGLTFAEADERTFASLNQYVGSVAVSRDGETAITTSPRGGVALEWETATRTVRQVHQMRDVCGAAPRGPSGLLLTAGSGQAAHLDAELFRAPHAWDNHVTAI
ncbi:MAG: DUF1513 domain-containing protein [Pseudomonadota bacterium]